VAIKIPYVLSFLSNDNFTSKVEGMKDLQAQYVKEYGPGNYIPPVFVTYWSFRFMFATGGLLALISMIGLYLSWKKRLEERRWFLWLLVVSIAFPYIANTSGWVLAEIGRQPWLVNGLLKTSAGVSTSVSPVVILISLITFIVLYGALAIVDAYLLFKFGRLGTEAIEEHAESKEEELVISY
jgi:cytochrome d ubiquinol oxidase subunit I